jgi:hypothetical protein
MINTREFFCSSNGDKWFLRHNGDEDHLYVKHVANAASGGHQTDYELHDFLHGPRAPERAALMKLIASLTETAFEQDI